MANQSTSAELEAKVLDAERTLEKAREDLEERRDDLEEAALRQRDLRYIVEKRIRATDDPVVKRANERVGECVQQFQAAGKAVEAAELAVDQAHSLLAGARMTEAVPVRGWQERFQKIVLHVDTSNNPAAARILAEGLPVDVACYKRESRGKMFLIAAHRGGTERLILAFDHEPLATGLYESYEATSQARKLFGALLAGKVVVTDGSAQAEWTFDPTTVKQVIRPPWTAAT